MPPPPRFYRRQNLDDLIRDFPELRRALGRYRCDGHFDRAGWQLHCGRHNICRGHNRLVLCNRARCCHFRRWCDARPLPDGKELGSAQKKHVETCIVK